MKINSDFESGFLLQNRNLQDILGKKTIISNRKQLYQNINQNGYSNPCNSKLNNLCCTAVQSSNTFRSTVTCKTFRIYNKLNCKSKHLVCYVCYATNNTQVNLKQPLRLNNYRKDVNKWNSFQANQHFWLCSHNFNKHAKFTLIKQLTDTKIDNELIKNRLKNI